MKTGKVLPAFAAGIAALVLAACPFESDPVITKAEYESKNTFVVYYTGEPDFPPSFFITGKDKDYNFKSSSSSSSWFDTTTKVTCKIFDHFISGDRITVTSGALPGSGEFDVPDYQE
jgi:hypothetical protein